MRLKTSLLDVDVAVAGPDSGPIVLLLHGWPDNASTWDSVAPRLNEAGFRTVAPTLRGFGETRFLSADTPRTGNTGVLAYDAIELLDALGIERFLVAGHDWGSNMAEALAVGWPDRVQKIAMLSTPPRLGGMPTPPFEQAQRQWYHWFQATERGAKAVEADPKGFARIMWENWAPKGWFSEETFETVTRSFENSDFVSVTLHSYRARWDEAEPDPRSSALEAKVKATKQLATPTLYIQGAVDGVNPPHVSERAGAKFSGPFERIVLPDVGHFPTREAPDDVAEALIRHFGKTF